MKYLSLEEENNWITVTLDRPEIRNAFNPEMIFEITDLFRQISRHESARGILLKGAGKAFCAGADLNWMKEMVKYTLEENAEDSGRLYDMFDAILQCNIPIVGYVHGSVFGGALGLMACCDYVIAEEKTQFCFSEVKLGLAPAVISSFVLKKTLYGKVAPFMLSAQVFNADQAIDMGLAHQKISVPSSLTDFNPANHEVFKKFQTSLNESGPEAVRATKELILNLQSNQYGPVQELKENTARVIAERRVCEEGQEGLQSFLEKRIPKWRLTENS